MKASAGNLLTLSKSFVAFLLGDEGMKKHHSDANLFKSSPLLKMIMKHHHTKRNKEKILTSINLLRSKIEQ